jgi:transcriptional regulator with XRE-family HTH domain
MDKIEQTFQLVSTKLKERGLNQGDLAKALGMSEGWMSQVFSKDIKVTLQTLLDIAKILGVEPASLIPTNAEDPQSFENLVRTICRDEISKDKEKTKA